MYLIPLKMSCILQPPYCLNRLSQTLRIFANSSIQSNLKHRISCGEELPALELNQQDLHSLLHTWHPTSESGSLKFWDLTARECGQQTCVLNPPAFSDFRRGYGPRKVLGSSVTKMISTPQTRTDLWCRIALYLTPHGVRWDTRPFAYFDVPIFLICLMLQSVCDFMAECTVIVSKGFVENCSQAHDRIPNILPYINPYLARRQVIPGLEW